MEEQTGQTRVDSISGLNLTDHNLILKVQGKQGLAGSFGIASNSYGSHVSHTNFQANNTQDGFSIAFWLFPTVFGSTRVVMSKNLEWTILQDSGGTITFTISGFSTTSASTMYLNQWNFVVVTYRTDTGDITSRINCDFPTTLSPGPFTPTHNANDFNLGAQVGFNTYRGYIDQIGIWQRLLQEADIDILCANTFFLFTSTSIPRAWSWAS